MQTSVVHEVARMQCSFAPSQCLKLRILMNTPHRAVSLQQTPQRGRRAGKARPGSKQWQATEIG
jgi:hypothetical protein